MLKLRKGKPKASPVPLGGGAVLFVRPATAFEVDAAYAAAFKLAAGLIEGEAAAETASAILGEEFQRADFTQHGWIDAMAKRIATLELAVLCNDGWLGVADEDGKPIETPTREWLALLLRDREVAVRVDAAINARVHEEIAEKKGSATLPNGGVAVVDPTAPGAGASGANAPTGDTATTGNDAPNSPTLQ